MDSKEKKTTIILFTVSFIMLLAGYFFVPFVVHIWPYIANLAGEKDMFLACTLLAYFVMFIFFGAGLGMLLSSYGSKWCKDGCAYCKKVFSRLSQRSGNNR